LILNSWKTSNSSYFIGLL